MEALTLFGQPRLHAGGGSRSLDWHAPAALLALLAVEDGWHAREKLANLLRPDSPSSEARLHLRRLIHRMRETFPSLAGLQVETARLRWAGSSDVQDFSAAMERRDWLGAIALQPAPLLNSVGSSGSAALDDRLYDHRRRLSSQLRKAFIAGVATVHERGEDAASLMQRLAELDPLDEEAVQFLLAHVSNSLERHTAFSAYQTLDRRLRVELGHKPSERTRDLVAALQSRSAHFAFGGAGEDDLPAPPPRTAAPQPVAIDNAGAVSQGEPSVPMPLGRDAELQALSALLRDPSAPLVTILGFGGVGKTSLARSLFESVRAELGRAATWVELSAIDSKHAMLDAIAAQVGMDVGDGPIENQLLHWFAARSHVLFLDNFEQLTASSGVIARLLAAAAGLRVVVTSRELLRVPQEHAFPLHGLRFDGVESPSVRLFEQHAARLGSPVSGDEHLAVVRLVEHLEGVPLAIELAANWTPLLPVHAVLSELKADPGFLDTASAPAARSMQSILAASWRRLDERERNAMTSLSTVLGAMNFETARFVAQADPQLLLGLANKSLLQRTPSGLLRVHPLLREFATSQGDTTVAREARARHAEHFLTMVGAGEPLRMGKFMPQRVSQLLPHVEDLAKAWRNAIEDRRVEWVAQAAPNLSILLVMTGRFSEISELMSHAASALGGRHPFAPSLAAIRSLAEFRLGRLDVAEGLVHGALDAARGPARALLSMVGSRIRRFRGEYAAALAEAQHAVDSCGGETDATAFTAMACVEELALCHWALGELKEAQGLLVHALSLAQRYDAQYVEGRALALLGIIRNSLGESREARVQLEAAIGIFEAIHDPYQVAFAQRGLSYVLLRLGDLDGQFRLAEEALQVFRDAGYPHEIGEGLFALVVAHDAAGRHAFAAAFCRDALKSCLAIGQVPIALRCIGALGAFLVARDRDLGIALMRYAAIHPALRRPDLAFIEERLAAIAATPAELARGLDRAQGLDFPAACRLAMGEAAA